MADVPETKPEPAKSTGLAAMDPTNYGVISTDKALSKKDQNRQRPDTNKYHDLLNAFRSAAFPKGSPDDQTGLEWENIEGEIMGVVLTQDIISGTPFTQIDDDFFNYATPQECLDKFFLDVFQQKFAEKVITNDKFLMPSVSVMNERLNRLMISYKRQGRTELVQMIQALQLSMSEQERTDPTKMIARRL